jgi:hypothetical protein
MMNRPQLQKRIKRQADIACTYLADGAFQSAARVLQGLADEAKAFADAVDVESAKYLASLS